MHRKPTSSLYPLSPLLLSLAVGCGAPGELEDSELLASEAQALKPSTVPPGLVPSLVKDIQAGIMVNGGEGGAASKPFPVSTGSVAYFLATTTSTGTELWRTDGTPEGTRLVRDLVPGPQASNITELAVAGDTVFLAQNTWQGGTLWKSDGTAEGTVPVRTAQGVTLSANELVSCGGSVYFHGVGNQGSQVWKTDGTPEGTVLLTTAVTFDFRMLEYDPSRFACADGRLFFVAPINYSSSELWTSDGTAEGTRRLASVGPLGWSWSGNPILVAAGSRVFLNTYDYLQPLWTSDGTPEGTRTVPSVGGQAGSTPPDVMAALGGKLFFTTFNWGTGTGLWTSDGTVEGTHKYLNVMSGPPPADPLSVSVVGDTVLFSEHQVLYKSDGTAEGTVRIKNSTLGTWGGATPGVVLPDGRMLFTASDSVSWRPFVSDGTEGGTYPLRTAQGQLFSWPTRYTRLGERVLFWGNADIHGTEPWVTDGTPAGTRMVRDITRNDSSLPRNLTDVEGTLFFTAFDAVNHRELWKSDGTAEGTALVKVLGPSSWNEPMQLTRVGGTLFFFMDVNSLQLWKSDGTEAGTVKVRDFGTSVGASMTRAVAAGSTLFFTAYQPATGFELWKSDGTAEGTVLVKDIIPGWSASPPEKMTAVGNTLFFIGTDRLYGSELWKTDGTAEGTVLVKDIRPGAASSLGTWELRELRAVGNTLFFTAHDGVRGAELWKSDGTAEGTVLVKDIRPGAGDSNLYDLAEVEGTLFFTAEDGIHGRELWKTDGTAEGTVLVKDVRPGSASPFPRVSSWERRSPVLDGTSGGLYFVADDGVHGGEPWKSDGTAEGTVLLRDVMPGPLGSGVGTSGGTATFVPVGPYGAVAFAASSGVKGLELWMTDGTAEGTRLLSDVAAGALSSSPGLLTVSGPRLFFVADEGVHGRELWSVKQAAFQSR